ncbi:hypothetical protein Tco_1457792 [Tanacetum coccineum]
MWPLSKQELATSMIAKLVNESDTYFEPIIRRPNGRPPKAKKKKGETSTTRDPSKFELVESSHSCNPSSSRHVPWLLHAPLNLSLPFPPIIGCLFPTVGLDFVTRIASVAIRVCDTFVLLLTSDPPIPKRYLYQSGHGTINMGLWYPKDSGFELTTFSDADHAGCLNTRKSTSGGIQLLGDKLVRWMSKKQDCIAMSLAEADISLQAVIKESPTPLSLDSAKNIQSDTHSIPVTMEILPESTSKLFAGRYGYCKNLKKTVKTGQTRTRERIENTRAGRMLSKVLQTVKTDMVKHDVEVESSGECVDEIDKLTEVSIKLINIGSMQVFDQFNISNKFAPLIRKSV